MAAATETVIGAAVRIDGERRGLLRVKGAKAGVSPTGLLEANPLADQLDDVDVLFDGVEISGHQAKYRARLALQRKLQQLLQPRRVDGLGDVLIEARLAREAAVALFAVAAEGDEKRVAETELGAYPPRHLVAIHLRHA